MSDARPTPDASACRDCGASLVALPSPGEHTHGTVAGVVTGPLGLRCPTGGQDAGHDVVAPTVAEAVAAVEDQLDVARRTAIRGTLRCGACDTPFALPGRRTTRAITITGAAPAVTITFDLPVLRCTEDAVDNVPPEALDDVVAVVTALLDAAR